MRESIKLRLRVTVCIRSKEKPPRRKLMHRFHLWFVTCGMFDPNARA